jgi:hypothetical protein
MKNCKHCKKEIEGNHSIYANHVRWCKENITNGDKGSKEISRKAKERYKIINGENMDFIVSCNNCKNTFKISEPLNKFPMKSKYFCNRSCSNTRVISEGLKEKISNRLKELWKDVDYLSNIINDNFTNTNKRIYFSSKGEREVIEYFKTEFSADNWSSGGGIIHDGTRLSRDLFSKKLKVIIEYDGVWHFKDIHGQLEDKQIKDKALEDWVVENNWRLIRIKEDVYKSNKQLWIKELVRCVYNDNRQIIKIY